MAKSEQVKGKFNEATGVSGLKYSNGWINEEYLPQLKTLPQRVKVWTEMKDNDAIVGSFLFIIDMLIRQVEWSVKAEDENNSDDVVAQEFIESCLTDMSSSWEETISEVLSMLPYGFSLLEKVFKVRRGENKNPAKDSRFVDGKIGWSKLAARSQDSLERWIFNDAGDAVAFIQLDPNKFKMIEIPLSKTLHFRTSAYKNNPEGRSVLRSAYKSYYFKKNIESIEGIGIERDLAGLPVIKMPYDTMKGNIPVLNEYKDVIRNIRRDEQEGVIIPSDVDQNGNKLFEFELMTSGGARQFNTNEIINRYDKRIATTVAADFILLGQDKVGSFALSSDKTNLFATAIGSWLDMITAVFNRQGVNELLKINNMTGRCSIVTGDIEKEDTEKTGRFLQSLSAAGAMLDNDQFNAVLEMTGLPPIKDDEDLV